MKKEKEHKPITKPDSDVRGTHQSDLAEGELETVEESLRNHERKGDLKPQPASTKSASGKQS